LNDRYVIKAFRVGKDFVPEQIAQYRTGAVLLDAFSAKAPGGTGQAFNWSVARHARQFTSKLFLAGGITPENVPEAIEVVRPYAIDVCSGVEFAPGRKDPKRIAQLVAATKGRSSVAAGK
jgi:phosphoribosylanthranilate isomerase